MSFEIIYQPRVVNEDIPNLPRVMKLRIADVIESKLSLEPAIFGKPLRKSLYGFRKLRVGDYRVIYEIEGKKVRIFMIQHRSVVYAQALKRL